MRTKAQIIDQLNKIRNPFGASHQAQHLLNKVFIEVLVDIRDELTALTTILGSVEKIIYKAG